MRPSSIQPRPLVVVNSSAIRYLMRPHCNSCSSRSSPVTWSSSAFRHGGIGLLRDAHEILRELRILLQERAVDYKRIAVSIEPDILPVQRAEIAAEFLQLGVARIVEIADDVDSVGLQRRRL